MHARSLLLPVALLAALAAGAAADEKPYDRLSVSGGGARAMVAGLAFFEQLAKRGGMVPNENQLQGLSGGSWAVLAHESIGAAEAMKRLEQYMAVPGHTIGQHISGLDVGLATDVWASFQKWERFVDSVVSAPLSPRGSPAFQYKSGGHASVLVGASVTTTAARVAFSHCVFNFWGDQPGKATPLLGRLKCLAGPSSYLWRRTLDKRASDTGRSTGPLVVSRRAQAVMSSMAFLFGKMHTAMGPFRAGLPVHAHLENQFHSAPHEFRLTLWDLGLKCNLAVDLDDLDRKGVTLAVDASDDDHLFESTDACSGWWKGAHGRFLVRSNDPTVVWNGRTVHLNRLGEYAQYVRLYDVHAIGNVKTGRRLLVVNLGRLDEHGELVPAAERLKGIETRDSLSADPKVFGKTEFDLLNNGVRNFYGGLLDRLAMQ